MWLTSSIWRVHDLLRGFFELHDFPSGPLLMSDARLLRSQWVADRRRPTTRRSDMADVPHHPFRFGLQVSEARDRRGWVEVSMERCAGSVVAMGVTARSNSSDSRASASMVGEVSRK